MSESPIETMPEWAIETADLPTETPDGIVTPQSGADTEPPSKGSDTVPLSAADRVRAAVKSGGSPRSGKGRRTSDAGPSTARATTPPPKPRAGTLVKPLTRLYVSVGTVLMPFDPTCAAAVINNAENCARSLEALAQENEAVRRAILALTATSAWGGLLIAHMPILLMVAVHHAPKDVATSLAPVASLMNDPNAFKDDEETGTDAA